MFSEKGAAGCRRRVKLSTNSANITADIVLDHFQQNNFQVVKKVWADAFALVFYSNNDVLQ